jgi:protein-S-isoprenylcysteine O-methyltransferase Ste14
VPLAGLLLASVWRLVDEERLLAANLPGYAAYRASVRYRLVPRLW